MELTTPLLRDLNCQKVNGDLLIHLDNLQEWGDYDGVDLSKDCIVNFKHFIEKIKHLTLEDFFKVNNIYLVEEKEIYDVDKFNSNRFTYLKNALDFFTLIGVKDKVTFLNNNLLCNYKNIKHRPITSFLLGSDLTLNTLPELEVYRNRPKKYRFLLLNRKPKKHRTEIFNHLKTEGYLSDTLYSHENFVDGTKTIDPHPYSDLPKSFITDCLVNIVTETLFYKTEYSGNCCFITEKVDKCLSGMMPFIVVGNHSTLKQLSYLGFQSFNTVWDETYDTEEDDTRRMRLIKELITEIGTWDDDKIKSVKSELLRITRHNRCVYEKLNLAKQKLVNYRMDQNTFFDFIFYDELLSSVNLKESLI